MIDSKKRKLVLLLTFQEINPSEGISKKILAEKRAFEQNGFECLLGRIEKSKTGVYTYKIADDDVINYGEGFFGKLRKLVSTRGIFNWITENRKDLTLLYVRYTHFSNAFYVRLFKKISKLKIKTVLEIPTYPYDEEYKHVNLMTKILHAEEKRTRGKLVKYVDYIITFSDDDNIWGIPTIKINNAIDFSLIPIREDTERDKDSLHLIGVANLMFWHGFDRVIEGLKNFYNKPQETKVFFHIVGDKPGSETSDKLYHLVKKYDISKYVIFHGVQSGPDLDQLFGKSSIAIGCLGCHRKGLEYVQSLKNVEYAARGIPFIYSEKNPFFDDAKYVLKAKADDTPLDIDAIIQFYDKFNLSSKEIRESVSALSWQNQIKFMLDYLNLK